MRITVFCGSSRRSQERFLDAASTLGRELARRRHVLIYGGGRTGLMGAVADAALEGGGRVEGVILREFIEQDVHHLGLDELYEVDDMRSRKAGLDERADAFVALPGGLGTLEELAEILSFRKLGFHHRPVVLLNSEGFYDDFVAHLERGIECAFDKPEVRAYIDIAADPVAALDACERETKRPGSRD